MKRGILPALAAGLFLLASTSTAWAQFPDMLRSILPGLRQAPAADAGTADGSSAAPLARSGKSAKEIQSEMAPDINCNRPRERFNVAEKVAEYGGTAAALRLQQLVSSNLQFSELSAEDRQMLHYLAATTVWVPAEVEARLGAIYDGASGLFAARPSLSDLERAELSNIEGRMGRIRGAVADYPAEIRLVVNPRLPDGAFARLGGVIQLSTRFLNGLGDAREGADFLLAHEVSHVYKRHAIKQIQYQLVSSSEGWALARKVLQRAARGAQVDVLGDGVFLLTTVPQLVEFVRSAQIQFGREQELEADACSTVWLKAVNTDPYLAWDLFHDTLGASDTSYSLEHPTNEERMRRFKQKAAGVRGGADPRGTDMGTVKKGGERLINDARRKKAP